MPSILNATTTTGLVSSADNSGSLQLATNNGTTAVTIDTSQNVGIGTSSPTAKLTINTSVSAGIHFFRSDVNANFDGIVFRNSANNTNQSKIGWNGNDLRFESTSNTLFETNGSERMRIDSSGRMTIPFQTAFAVIGTGSGNKSGGTVLGFTDTGGSSNININVGSCWSNANNRFTAPVAGTYMFIAAIYLQNANTVIQPIVPFVNGGALSQGDTFMLFGGLVGSGNNDTQVNGSFILRLAANDYVDLRVRSGYGPLSYYAGHSFFQGWLLG